MTIGIDGSRAFVEGRTGTENYSYQLIRNMSLIDTENKQSFSTSKQSLRFDDAKRNYLIYIKPGQNPGKDWPDNFKFVTINLPRLWTQIGLAFRTWIDPLDVLFIPSHTLPLLKKPGLKTVLTVHDLGAEYLPGLHQLKQILYLKLMTHYQLKTATKIISVSKATKEDLVKRIGFSPAKVEVVYEGVDKTVFKKMPKDAVNDIVKNYDIERGKYFLFVGTIHPRKNIGRLIRSFAEFLKQSDRSLEVRGGKWSIEVGNLGVLKESTQSILKSKNHTSNSKTSHLPSPTSKIKLVLVGSKGWKSDAIYKLPKELDIEENVRFLGRIPDPELVALYNGALGLTYPSLFEGFGLPILEAFACGCPVITSNVSSMPEVAGEAALLVNPENEVEIAEGMFKLYKDDRLRSSLISKGTLRLERFDWKITAKKTIEILERTVDKKNL